MVFLLLIFLFPIALYCAALAAINRQERPLMVSGTWDFAGAVLASSGFLLVAGPAILAGFYSRTTRLLLLRLDGRNLALLLGELGSYGVWPWALYYGGVIVIVLALLWWRRTRTVIYNIDPLVFDQVVHGLLERHGFHWRRLANRIWISASRLPAGSGASGDGRGPSYPRYPGEDLPEVEPTLRIEPFHAMFHVTLHWRADAGLVREEVEADLVKQLAKVTTTANPAAGWLLGFSAALFGVMTVAALVIIFGTLVLAGR